MLKLAKIPAQIAFFVAVVLLGDRVVSISAKYIIRKSQNQFVRMYEGKYPANIVLLGDSRVDRNIDIQKIQELTGKICLNLGLGGNSVLISEALLRDYVERYGIPELVVIELSHTTTDSDNMGEMRIFSYCSKNIEGLAKKIDPTYAEFESVFTSLQFNDPAFWRLAVEVFSKPASRLLNNTIPPEIRDRWEDGHHVERPIIAKNMEALERLCKYAELMNIKLKLIICPSWKKFKKAISNYDLWKSTVQNAVGRHIIYDYSEVFFDQPDYFNDEMHLNAIGANYFAKKLVEDKVL